MKSVASAFMEALLLASILTVVLRVQLVKTEPTTISVPDDYATIKDAVSAADAGGTVFVRSGT